MEIKEKITQLRQKMKEAGIDVYYIPMSDCHNSEYVAPHFRCIEFISGFTGSAASVVVTQERAFLFTDGRYYIQAAMQLEGSGIELMKMGQPGVPELEDFIRELSCGKVLGFDGSVVSARFGRQFSGTIVYDRDLAGEIWTDRPKQVFTDIFELPLSSTGESASDKVARVRKELERLAGTDRPWLYILNSLDDIAWIFNLRADDVQNNPVFYAYTAITPEQVTLFTGAQVPEIPFAAGQYTRTCLCMEGYEKVLMDPGRISYDTYRFYHDRGVQIVEVENPSTLMKAVKNETEIRALTGALEMDSAVMVEFMYWLKTNVGKIPMDEVSAADHLQEMRQAQEGFIELSFDTISAYRENAALMHYGPKRGQCSRVLPEGMLLVDSGGQYETGTTDITRTFVLGPVTQEEKKAFTLTAVSMLRLMNTKFIKGCRGENLDLAAREPMWQAGWDYKCGTGHGVGHVLGVHEGPHRIKWQTGPHTLTAPLEPGMIVTDEPGVYREGAYGVRTENELLVTEYMETQDGTFYQFRNLTWIPIDLDGIDPAYLSGEDRKMLNEYHRQVYEIIAPRVRDEVRGWLKEYTREL